MSDLQLHDAITPAGGAQAFAQLALIVTAHHRPESARGDSKPLGELCPTTRVVCGRGS